MYYPNSEVEKITGEHYRIQIQAGGRISYIFFHQPYPFFSPFIVFLFDSLGGGIAPQNLGGDQLPSFPFPEYAPVSEKY